MREQAADRDQPVDRRRQLVHRGRRPRVPGHADAEHEDIAEPEGQPGEEADFCDVDGAEAVLRIDPETDRAAGEHGGADIVADRVAGEARQCSDAIGHVLLADGPQREEIIEGQRAERADHAECCERDLSMRNLRQRNQDHAGIDTPQGADHVEMAKAMMTRLARIPSRFQPIRSLKPRPSAVSSRYIHPPGRAATICAGVDGR